MEMHNQVPEEPKIYYIVHLDRLKSIVNNGYILCNREVEKQGLEGIEIGMSEIKQRRMNELKLSSHNIYVGDCVPFYFCPRSVMLYLLHKSNHQDMDYKEGQEPIVHLEADLYKVVKWGDVNNRRWAFTSSSAATRFFEDYTDLGELHQVNWNAVQADDWRECRDEKQAEFLIEHSLPCELIKRIGVQSEKTKKLVFEAVSNSNWLLSIEIIEGWYY